MTEPHRRVVTHPLPSDKSSQSRDPPDVRYAKVTGVSVNVSPPLNVIHRSSP